MGSLKTFKNSDLKVLLNLISQLDSQKRSRQIKQIVKDIGIFLTAFHFTPEQYEKLHIIVKLIRCRLLSIQIHKLIGKL